MKDQISKRIKVGKYQGDDHYSWAVFIDSLPFVTGLAKNELRYYRRRAYEILSRKVATI